MEQLELIDINSNHLRIRKNHKINKLDSADRAFHDGYRFVLSFPPHLVRDYFNRFGLRPGMTVLDHFCGTGTTLIEAKLKGMVGVGIEANPMAHFAATVKVDWNIKAISLKEYTHLSCQRIKAYPVV